MNLKEKIENNLTIWILGVLLTGFLAGLGTYKGILKIANLEVVSKSKTKSKTDPNIYWMKIKKIQLSEGDYFAHWCEDSRSC